MDETPVDTAVPSARFHYAGESGSLRQNRYVAHMSGSWHAELINPGASHPVQATAWNLGSVVVTANDFPERRVARSEAMVRADQMDHYYVHLPLANRGLQLEANGDRLSVPTGAPVLMDLSRAFDTHQGAGRSLQAFMPREMLDELLPGPRDLHATRLQGAAAGLLADHLQSLARRLPAMDKAEAAAVATSTMYLVVASLAPTIDTLERARPVIESTLLRQACRYIEMHLKEPELGAPPMCAALRISRATLYRLFEPYGGVANHIKERRLVRIHGAITTPSQQLSLGRIAEDHGFKNAAHFSRAFRQHFGYSPSDASPWKAVTTVVGNDLPYNESLAAWLRPLRG